MKFGAGAGHQGTVLMLTFGTGIGSALFRDGILVPNTEFGHIEIRGRDAEKRASERAKELHDLSWGKWAGRVDEYLHHVEALTAPDLIIIGGGISRKADKFLPLLTSLRATVVPAAMQNNAGIVGAALGRPGRARGEGPAEVVSGDAGDLARGGWAVAGPAARRLLPDRLPGARSASLTSPIRSWPKWNTLAASTASAPAPTAGAKWASSPAPPLAMMGTSTTARTARMSSRSKPALVPSASMELSRISPTPSSAPRAAHCHRVDPGAPPAPVRGDLEPGWPSLPRAAVDPAGVHGQHHALRAEPLGRLRRAVRGGRWPRCSATPCPRRPAAAGPRPPTLRTPPPTVSGMNTWSAVRPTTSIMVSRSPLDAVMSRNTSSSAPSAS